MLGTVKVYHLEYQRGKRQNNEEGRNRELAIAASILFVNTDIIMQIEATVSPLRTVLSELRV